MGRCVQQGSPLSPGSGFPGFSQMSIFQVDLDVICHALPLNPLGFRLALSRELGVFPHRPSSHSGDSLLLSQHLYYLGLLGYKSSQWTKPVKSSWGQDAPALQSLLYLRGGHSLSSPHSLVTKKPLWNQLPAAGCDTAGPGQVPPPEINQGKTYQGNWQSSAEIPQSPRSGAGTPQHPCPCPTTEFLSQLSTRAGDQAAGPLHGLNFNSKTHRAAGNLCPASMSSQENLLANHQEARSTLHRTEEHSPTAGEVW